MDKFRIDRIERLLKELRYEVERGMLNGEVEETIGFRFIVPLSKEMPEGVVFCEFHTRPMHKQVAYGVGMEEQRLKVVKS